MLSALAVPLAYTGAALGVTMVVPQIVRTVRHPALAGVSVTSWSLTSLACLTWLVYGVRTGTVPQVPGNALMVSGAVAVVLLVPSELSPGQRAVRWGLAAASLVALACVVPAHSVGYLALGLALVASWPQLYRSLASTGTDESGLAISTWSMRVAGQTCWLSYALLAHDLPVVLSACVSLTAATALVTVESSRRVSGRRAELVAEPA